MQRLITILGLALLVAGLTPVGLPAAEGRPGKGYRNRHPQIMERIKSGRPIDLVFFGDSITEGWSKAPELWTKLEALNAANFGIGSEETRHLLYRVTGDELDGYEAKVVVLMIGVNDISHKVGNAKTISASIQRILAVIRDKQPKATVVLMGLLPFGKTPEAKTRKVVAGVNGIIKDYADGRHVIYVNAHDRFLDAKGEVIDGTMDGAALHPTEQGYRLWYDVLMPVIGPLLKK